jgi:hypothetical protein
MTLRKRGDIIEGGAGRLYSVHSCLEEALNLLQDGLQKEK